MFPFVQCFQSCLQVRVYRDQFNNVVRWTQNFGNVLKSRNESAFFVTEALPCGFVFAHQERKQSCLPIFYTRLTYGPRKWPKFVKECREWFNLSGKFLPLETDGDICWGFVAIFGRLSMCNCLLFTEGPHWLFVPMKWKKSSIVWSHAFVWGEKGVEMNTENDPIFITGNWLLLQRKFSMKCTEGKVTFICT